MARTYTHRTEIDGASMKADVAELQRLVDRAIASGMTRPSFEDTLAQRTGFEHAVRTWLGFGQMPNGLARRIILNNARQLVIEMER